MKLTISDAARLAGKAVPNSVPSRCFCPIRKHKRKDKTFRIFRAADGKELWKCWSCDEPDNTGDGLKLYCLLTGSDRKDAFKMLLERGFDFEGARRNDPREEWMKKRRFIEKPKGPAQVLPLPSESITRWLANDMRAVSEYMKRRGLVAQDWRALDVCSMGGDYVGFVYRDPDTGAPCRVKVRSMTEKRFWNEPRSDSSRPDAKAKAPLWMGHALVYGEPAVVVEGEVDALTLILNGVKNVVSLPDGSESAGTVDLKLLRESCQTWVVATDDDEPGERAWRTLKQRAEGTGNVAVRRKFRGLDGAAYKDANEALVAGFRPEDFARCLEQEV